MTSKEHNSGVSISQMELLRTKGTRFCRILQSSVIPRLKLDERILFLLIQPWRKLRWQMLPYLEMNGWTKVWKIEKYKVLKDEIARMWDMKEVIVIPVVAGCNINWLWEVYCSNWDWDDSRTCTKNSFIGDGKDFETGRWMLKKKKKKHNCKYHCAGLCETFDNRLLSALTE